MDTIQNQTQKSTTEKSIEDTEIENLDKKRKELRQKTNRTLKDKVEYAEVNKLAKKKRRTRARRKRKELILETLEARKGPRQINKHRKKKQTNDNEHEERIWRNHNKQRRNTKTMRKFLQVTLYPNSAHTRKYNEIKP